MLIRKNPNGIDLPFPSEITPREVYEGRRAFLAKVAASAVAGSSLWEMATREALAQGTVQKLPATRNPAFATTEKQTSFEGQGVAQGCLLPRCDHREPRAGA